MKKICNDAVSLIISYLDNKDILSLVETCKQYDNVKRQFLKKIYINCRVQNIFNFLTCFSIKLNLHSLNYIKICNFTENDSDVGMWFPFQETVEFNMCNVSSIGGTNNSVVKFIHINNSQKSKIKIDLKKFPNLVEIFVNGKPKFHNCHSQIQSLIGSENKMLSLCVH